MIQDGTNLFHLEIECAANKSQDAKILELNYVDGTNLLFFGIDRNNSFWLESAYFNGRIIFKANEIESKDLEFVFNTNFSSNSSDLKVLQEKFTLTFCFF